MILNMNHFGFNKKSYLQIFGPVIGMSWRSSTSNPCCGFSSLMTLSSSGHMARLCDVAVYLRFLLAKQGLSSVSKHGSKWTQTASNGSIFPLNSAVFNRIWTQAVGLSRNATRGKLVAVCTVSVPNMGMVFYSPVLLPHPSRLTRLH